MKQGQPDSVTVEDYLISNLTTGNAIGFDPFLLTYDAGSKLLKKLNSVGLKPVAINENLVDKFWTDRPTLSNKKAILSFYHFNCRFTYSILSGNKIYLLVFTCSFGKIRLYRIHFQKQAFYTFQAIIFLVRVEHIYAIYIFFK